MPFDEEVKVLSRDGPGLELEEKNKVSGLRPLFFVAKLMTVSCFR